MSLSSETFAILSNASHHSAAVVNRDRRGDEAAFTEIFERHRQLIYQVCLRYVRHHHDAEDITQETFRRAALAMPSVDAQRPLEPWLVTIAANRCRSFLSRQQRDRRLNSLAEVTATCGTEHDCARRLSLSEQLDRALDRLPTDQRRAFELIHQKELSYPEAARLMGRPLGTVKTWVRRAKRDMQDTLLAADTADMPVGLDSPIADGASRRTGSTAAENMSQNCEQGIAVTAPRVAVRSRATAVVASLVVLGCFGIARHQQPGFSSTAATATIASVDPVSEYTTREEAEGLLDLQSHPADMDWQWVSLDAFLRARLSVENIHALPLGRWMQRTSPALNPLRSGIRPLKSTLHRVAELFQCELAQIVSPRGSTLDLPSLDAPGEVSSVDQATQFDDLGRAAALMHSSRCSTS